MVTNLAVLVSPIFMMQVLDRVVPSENISTLLMLLMVALGAIATHAFVEFYRDQFFFQDRAVGRSYRGKFCFADDWAGTAGGDPECRPTVPVL